MQLMRAGLHIMCLQCVLLAGWVGVAAAKASMPPPITAAPVPPLLAPVAHVAKSRESLQLATPLSPPSATVPSARGPSESPPLPPSPEDLLFACPTTLDHIGRVVAAVSIDGKGPFRFILDTGANHSTISPRLAATLGLKPSTRQLIDVTGVTGTAEEPSVLITKLQAGELAITNSRFPVIWASVMAGADGILGAAGLRKDRIFVSFQHNQVIITRSRTEALPWGFSRMWATRLHGGLLSVPGRVGGVRVRAIIDTGSQRTLGNLALYRQLFAEEQGKGKYLNADVYGATRQVGIGKLQIAPSINLGAIKISGVGLVFGDFNIFRAWGLTHRPTIILGMDVLGTVKAFVIDFRYGEIGIDTTYDYYESASTAPP
ncbi:MAG: aspartyl protease family protein [Steroidobacteraceae bacterium]